MKRVRKPANANSYLPESLTSVAIQGINSLPSNRCPKIEYLQAQFLTKYVSADTVPGGLRQTRAIRKWLATEANNVATSDRIIAYPGHHQILPGVDRVTFEETARRFIADIIGDTPPYDSYGSFSGGASTSRKRGKSLPSMKYLGEAHVTPEAVDYCLDLVLESDLWSSYLFSSDIPSLDLTEVRGNLMFTVPKSTEIDRCACKEPDLNMYAQRAIGNAIRSRLARVGVNLNDQSINRNLARLGSETGQLATMDLSSASDSVTTELVSLLLPPIWYSVMDTIRCKETFIPLHHSYEQLFDTGFWRPTSSVDGYWHKNTMFSSMGNGFTFELESLLFYALARASAYHLGVRGRISVYGDDIIIPSGMYHYLAYVLGFYGFEVNPSKSFSSGPFRESCGGHYFAGYDISPFYLRRPLARQVDLINFLNQMRYWDCRDSVGVDTYDLWKELSAHVDPRLHGGHNYASPYTLVSPQRGDPPMRLSPMNEPIDVEDANNYLYWLDSRCGRAELHAADAHESRPIATLSACRLRKRPAWDLAKPICGNLFYYEEVMPSEAQ